MHKFTLAPLPPAACAIAPAEASHQVAWSLFHIDLLLIAYRPTRSMCTAQEWLNGAGRTSRASSGMSRLAIFSAVAWSPVRYAVCICILSISCSRIASTCPTCSGQGGAHAFNSQRVDSKHAVHANIIGAHAGILESVHTCSTCKSSEHRAGLAGGPSVCRLPERDPRVSPET